MQRHRSHQSVSIVVPTLNEQGNIMPLVERTFASLALTEHPVEMVFVDDRSRDGTLEEVLHLSDRYRVRGLLRNERPRCLSSSVLLGIHSSESDYVVVMDADLSHPPESIPSILAGLDDGAEFVLGSRNVDGASIDEHWGWFRWLNAWIAGSLALPLTKVSDPCAGFFGFRRNLLDRAPSLDPVGYKIGLEILVKCRARRIVEVPIRFAQRAAGRSKLSFREQLRYLEHLRRLYLFRLRSLLHRKRRRASDDVLVPATARRISATPGARPARRSPLSSVSPSAQQDEARL